MIEDKTRNYKGRPKGAKNKINKDVKLIMQDIVETNLPKVMDRLDEMSVKDQANTLIQMAKFIVPQMKSQEVKIEDNKKSAWDEDVLEQICNGLKL